VHEYTLAHALRSAGFRPDLVFVELFGPRWFLRGLEACEIPLVAVVYDSVLNHFWLREYLALFDHVFVDFSESVDRLAEHGIRAHWSPYAIELEEFAPRTVTKTRDIAFVGTLDQRPRRAELFKHLSEHFDVRAIGGYTAQNRVSPARIGEVYASARIVVNECLAEGLNFRAFEALASGSMLLTEHTAKDLPRLFRPGVHLATYTPRNLLERVRFYLRHDAERESIARAGRDQVFARHTRSARARFMLDVIAEEWKRPRGADRPLPLAERSTSQAGLRRAQVRERRLRSARAQYFFSRRWPSIGQLGERRVLRSLRLAGSSRVERSPTREQLLAIWVRGAMLAERGRLNLALRDLQGAASWLPQEALVRWHLGLAAMRAGDRELAQRAILAGAAVLRAEHSPWNALLQRLIRAQEFEPQLFLVLAELLAEREAPVESNSSIPNQRTFPWSPVDFLYRSIDSVNAYAPLRIAEWHADAGDAPAALLLHEGIVGRNLATPESMFHMGTQALRCFERERGLDLIRRALEQEPGLEALLSRLDLSAIELSRLRLPPSIPLELGSHASKRAVTRPVHRRRRPELEI